MASRRTSSVRVQRDSRGFTSALSSAILEWLLIFLLFIDALFSYLVTKFAHYCKLQTPCLICSRLDHFLGDKKPEFYRDLICGAHKLEFSSLVFCKIHDKLADVHGMCESCLLSFATDKKYNSKTYKLLVGELGTDLDSSIKKHCSCCNEPWASRSCSQGLVQTKPIESKVTERKTPLPASTGHSGLNLHDGLKKRRVKPSGSMTSSYVENRIFDPLSHVGYTELKITSDSESEFPFSDDDDVSALLHEKDDLKEEFLAQCIQPEPLIISPDSIFKTPSDGLAPEKLIDQLDIGEPHIVTSSVSTIAIGHGLEELNWHQVERKADPPALSELISLHDAPSSSNIVEVRVEASEETLDVSATEIGEACKPKSCLATTVGPDLEKELVVEVSRETLEIVRTGDIGQTSITESEEVCEKESGLTTTTGLGLKIDQGSNETGSLVSNLVDLSDAYKIAVGNKGSQVCSTLGEQLTNKDSAKFSEDLKLFLSQIPSTRGLEVSSNDMSPRIYGLGEELKMLDASSSMGLDMLQRRITIERNESGFESLDGSIVSEIEGESVLDRLKRQVEYDRKFMNALYKELEEERNASAISANQAMAMITRLQEEKAALHMEALQYLRMMEEQAEYDIEALQKANELLAEREKDIQDLEAELENYRKSFPDESMVETIQESVCHGKEGDMRVEHSDARCSENSSYVPCNSSPIKNSDDINKNDKLDVGYGDKSMSVDEDSKLLDFEEERLYISQCLKKLEKKLNIFSNNGVSNGGYSGKKEHGINGLEYFNEAAQGISHKEEDEISVQKESSITRDGPQIVSEENHHLDCDGKDSINGRATDLVSLENEVLDLNERLKALETDRNFLEHAINLLRNGDEGVHFIQEMASHLRELRNVGLRGRE